MQPQLTSEADWTKPAGVVAFFVLVVGAVALTMWRNRHRTAEEQKQRDAYIEEGLKQGVLNEHGQPLCVVCGEVATTPTPRTGRMWIDRIPGMKLLNELTAMPRRYSVDDGYEGGPRLCAGHNRSARQQLRRVHATMRAEHAEFNARQELKIHMLDQGGLERMVLQEARDIKTQLGLNTSMRTLLHSNPDDSNATPTTHVLAVSTDVGDEGV